MTNNITNEQIINAIDNGWTKELRALADGKVIQGRPKRETQTDWISYLGGSIPMFAACVKYRVKPVEKTVTHYSMLREGLIEVHNSPPAKGAYGIIVDVHTFTYTEEE